LQVYLYLWFIRHIFAPSFPYNKKVSLNIRRVGNDRENGLKYPFVERKSIKYY
jgi:hypothetical protein